MRPRTALSDSPLHPLLHPPLQYATLCEFMLVPTEEERLPDYPEEIEGYGARGWCRCEQEERRRGAWGSDARLSPLPRCEFFIFALWAEMQEKVYDWKVPGSGVPLYAIKRDGALK